MVSDCTRKISLAPLGLLLGAALVTGCSQTSVDTAAYSAPSIKINTKTRALGTGIGDLQSDALSLKRRNQALSSRPRAISIDYDYAYAAKTDGDIQIPAFNYKRMNSRYLRQQVPYFGPEAPGTIVVDAKKRLLYLVEPNGMAMRYGIAVGKEGFGWTGNAVLQWKQKWPTWTPPPEMIERKPELKKYADGLKGSPENPLGARAMYLFKDGRDTMYRIHGTTKPFSIGKAASSGCFRMINQDVIDLYDRVGRKNIVNVRTTVSNRVAYVEPLGK